MSRPAPESLQNNTSIITTRRRAATEHPWPSGDPAVPPTGFALGQRSPDGSENWMCDNKHMFRTAWKSDQALASFKRIHHYHCRRNRYPNMATSFGKSLQHEKSESFTPLPEHNNCASLRVQQWSCPPAPAAELLAATTTAKGDRAHTMTAIPTARGANYVMTDDVTS